MSEYTGCDICKHQKKSKREKPCLECTKNRAINNFEPMTNADAVRNMTDEELAEMLHNIGSYVEGGEPKIDIWLGEKLNVVSDDFGSIQEWLQAEVEEGENDG